MEGFEINDEGGSPVVKRYLNPATSREEVEVNNELEVAPW